MKNIFTCLALCLSLLPAVAQEAPAIEGLYGVKLGAKPGGKAIDLGGGMASIFDIRVVALPEMKKEGETVKCNAILKQPGGLSPLEKSDRKLDKCGGFIVFYKVRICYGKSERAPRFYFIL